MMIYAVAILAFLMVSFVFAGIEAGILSINRVRLRHRVKLRDRAALRLERLLARPERLLMTTILVTNLMNILAISLMTVFFVRWWGRGGYAIALLIGLPLSLFGLELFPKSLFRRFPYRALALLSEPLVLADRLLGPLLNLGTALVQRIIPVDEPITRKLFAGREDFKYFTVESERSGTLSPVERELIHGIVDFRSLTARDVMQPLSAFPAIRYDCTVDDLIAASEGGSIDRFLVTGDGSDANAILGVVSLFDALLDRGPRTRASTFVRRLISVSANETAPRLLRKLRVARTPIALVTEAGEPLGLVFAETLYRRLISPPAP
jgi:CBS domain containing-hemolysin-like protein